MFTLGLCIDGSPLYSKGLPLRHNTGHTTTPTSPPPAAAAVVVVVPPPAAALLVLPLLLLPYEGIGRKPCVGTHQRPAASNCLDLNYVTFCYGIAQM